MNGDSAAAAPHSLIVVDLAGLEDGPLITDGGRILDPDLLVLTMRNDAALDQMAAIAKLCKCRATNIPFKALNENRNVNNNLDNEITKVLGTSTPLSDDAFARAKLKLAFVKAHAADSGLSDENIALCADKLAALRNRHGDRVDVEYPIVFKNGKPYNAYKDKTASVTGMTKAGKPHMATTRGKEKAAKDAADFAKNTPSPGPGGIMPCGVYQSRGCANGRKLYKGPLEGIYYFTHAGNKRYIH